MCYFSGKLYTTGYGGPGGYLLAVYSVTDVEKVTLLDTLLLDTLDVGSLALEPRVDQHSGRVYIPCQHHGVYVVRYDGRKLVLVTTLRCVGDAVSLAVVSSDTLYVCDGTRKTVCLVDITQDRETARLLPPLGLRDMGVDKIAVLGDTVLVLYEERNLVLYQHGVPKPGKILPWPREVNHVNSLTTDHHFSFLLRGDWSVFVLDFNGNLTHSIPVPRHIPLDCTVVRDQLWVPSGSGRIVVILSSQC